MIIVAISLSSLIKILIARERPDVLKLVIEDTYSFPSGHTTAIVTLTTYLLYLLKKGKGKIGKKGRIILAIFLVLITFLVMFSRIYLGAHYASDILGGIILALFVFLNITYYLEKKH